MPLLAGTMLNHYRLRGLLGAGDMGEVYEAEDTRLRRNVAIKILPELTARPDERSRCMTALRIQ